MNEPIQFEAVNLPTFQATYSSPESQSDFASSFTHKIGQKWAMYITLKGVETKLLFSELGIKRVAAGIRAYANWYRKNDSDEWQYVGRYAVEMTIQ
jgi:hypothetical protein